MQMNQEHQANVGNLNVGNLFEDAIRKAASERGHINILIAGKTGVGKSTLINAMFQKKMATTGQGRPVTKNTTEIRKEGVPLTIYDTRGLELSEFKDTIGELEQLIESRCSDVDSNRHIHLAWLCIQEDGRRVEEAEIELHKMLARHIPVITVITKARNDAGFINKVKELLPESRNHVRVRAIEEVFDDGYWLKPMGLEELVEVTSEVIPEGKRRAFSAAQRASIKYKKEQANKVVTTSVAAAAAAGASPIPFSDVAILAPIQIGMLAGISSAFGMDISKSSLSTLVSSAIGVTATSLAGRTIVSNLLKMVPGMGTLGGAAISASTAAALTRALGKAYISVLVVLYEQEPDGDFDIETVAKLLKEKITSFL